MIEPAEPPKADAGPLADLAIWAVIIAVTLAVAAGIAWVVNLSMAAADAGSGPLIAVEAPPAPAPAATIDEQGRAVRNPAWAIRPSGEFPDRAMRKGVTEGSVALNCRVRTDGTMDDCRIVSETPADAGFAAAAIDGVALARLHPRMVEGEAVAARISFTTHFRLE